MKKTHRAAFAALAVGLVGVVGCGGGGGSASKFSGEEKNVAQVIDEFKSAVNDRDTKKICSDILAKAQSQQYGSSCSTILSATLAKEKGKKSDLSVDDIKVTGKTATATGKEAGQKITLSLIKEDGQWRLNTLK